MLGFPIPIPLAMGLRKWVFDSGFGFKVSLVGDGTVVSVAEIKKREGPSLYMRGSWSLINLSSSVLAWDMLKNVTSDNTQYVTYFH
jgi:hypothetical protein